MFISMIAFFSLLQIADGQPNSRVGDALSSEWKENKFKATLTPGFHFNEKAPNGLILDSQMVKPTKLSAQEIEFTQFPEKWTDGKARLYICDDAVTFCESRTVVLKESGPAKNSTHTIDGLSKGKVNKFGFIEDDYAKALALAAKEKKLLLVDFAARWCPGCVRLEKEIFGTKEFKNRTRNFVKLKIDTDRFENSILSEKFNIKAIPSLVVINPQQQEIDRILDFQPQETINAFLLNIEKDPTPLQELKEKAKQKDMATLLRFGKRLLSAGREQESAEILKQVQPEPPEYARARVLAAAASYAEKPETKGQYIQTLKDVIRVEPKSSRSIEWRERLTGLVDNEKEKGQLQQEGVALADDLLAHPEKLTEAVKSDEVGEFVGFEALMVAMLRASLLNNPDGWQKAAQIGQESRIPLKNVGVNMRYIIVLTQAQRFDEAEKLILSLLKKNPNDPELLRRRLRVLLGQKKYQEAISLGKSLIEKSYGRNEFYVVEVLAKSYLGADQKAQAKELIDRYLNRSEIHFPNMKSSKKSLEELKQKTI